MKTLNIYDELKSNSYPGRGIVIGKSADGKSAVTAYFIMGRSVNSRNRVFTETEDGIKTEAADPSKLSDPHLIIYSPVRVLGNKTIVTNGDQTDTIYELMDKQQTFEQSLRTREYEDDAPNYTPRISGIMHVENGAYNYAMSILKSADGNPDCCERFTYTYTNPLDGVGHFIHTYMGDGNPLPSFEGEPKKVEIPNDIEEFTGKLWEALNEDNKVSLFVRYIDIASGKAVSKIVNKVRKVFSVDEKTLSVHYDELGKTLGETLLTPTKIYVKAVMSLLDSVKVKAISHITGGGFYENIPRSLPSGLSVKIARSDVQVLPIFDVIAKTGNIPERDMFNTFNMGVGMTVVVDKADADKAIEAIKAAGEEAYVLGELVDSDMGVIIC